MESEQEILQQTIACLQAHKHPEWGDRQPFDVFNRLLAKNIKPDGWTKNTHTDFTPAEVHSRREQWTTAELGRLTRGHSDKAGRDFGCPIILVEYDGNTRVLDGNHRINRWVAADDRRVHDVNIHTVDRVGRFVELPATT